MRTRTREYLDFYRTPRAAVEVVAQEIDVSCVVWEPCAGDGAMSDVFTTRGNRTIVEDINPRREDISKSDFLKQSQKKGDVLVTNPPFILADEMVRHAVKLSIPSWWLMRLQYIGTLRRHIVTKLGLKKLIIIPNLIKFTTSSGRVMNGNGTGQCGWFYFEPGYSGDCRTRWTAYSPATPEQKEK